MIARIYALLLRAYPPSFRKRFHQEMLRAFRDGRREARARGGTPAVWLHDLRAGLDAVVHGALERLATPGRLARGGNRGRAEEYAMDDLGRDLRTAFRGMRRRPAFTAVAVLTLGLAVGADTAIFSVMNGVLLRPLDVPDPGKVVVLRDRDRRTGRLGDPSAPNVEDWMAMSASFESVALVWGGAWAVTGDGLEAEQIRGGRVSAELFDVLRLQPAVGRFFRPEENVGDPGVAVISHGLWRSRYGGDPGVVGRRITVDGRPREIVGVLPPVAMPVNAATVELTEARGSRHLWLPIDEEDPWYQRRGSHFTLALARLEDGVDLARARAEMSGIARTLEERWPATNTGLDVAVRTLRDEVVGDVRAELFLVLGAVTLVLLVACANLANLLVARGVDRQRETAVRAALGAGRRRLVRQALTEAAVLGLAASAVGAAVAWLGTDLLVTLAPDDLPRLSEVAVDLPVLGYAVAVAVLAAVGAAAIPALQGGRTPAGGALATGVRGGSAGRGINAVRSALVVGQLALGVVLLAGSGLLLRTLVELRAVDPGARTEHVLAVPFYLSGARYGDAGVNRATQEAIREAVAALPGVEGAVLAYDSPVSTNWYEGFTVVGRPDPEPGQVPRARFRPVGTGYVETMEVAVLEGRSFTASDRLGAPGAVMVNRALTERYFPGERAVGRRIRTGTPRANFPEAPEEWTIVGIVENIGFTGPRGAPEPALYVPVAQFPVGYLQVLAPTRVDPASLVQAARRAVWSVDPDLPLPGVAPLSDEVDRLVARERFVAVLAAVFALVALAVAAGGVYGVMSYTVSAGRAEMGVRLALGAAPGRVLTAVLGRGLALASTGLVLGTGCALVLGRAMSGFLFRVPPWDAVVLSTVTATLLAVALVATLLPARRAARTDPAEALRGG